jgi:tetratricopeptide (TPR) repeat protein
MPSHIFTRLGLWQESIQSNLDSQVASQKYAAKYHPDAAYYEELHAMDYLMYAYLQLGRDEDAKGVVEQAQKIEKVQPLQFSAAYAFAAIPARYAIERNLWAEAAALKLHPEAFPWNRFPYAEANLRFAVALGAARSKNLTAAQEEIKRLESLRDSLSNTKDNYRWYDLVEIHRLAAAGWLAHEQGNQDQAETLLRNAADLEDRTDKHPVTPGSIIPARELLADFLLETNKPAEALKEFEASLTQAPNRFHGLAGAARTAKLAGNSKKAAEYYSRLESLCGTDCNRPEFRDLKTFLAKK